MKVNVEAGHTGIELIAETDDDDRLLREMWLNGIRTEAIDIPLYNLTKLTIAPIEDTPDA